MRRGRSRGHSLFWHLVVVGIVRPLLFLLVKRRWRGQENIPREGGAIVAANHLSWADPLMVAHFLFEAGRWPVFLAKSTLFEVPLLGRILRSIGQIPVYRHSTDAALALRDAERGVNDGACLIIYPEGTCTRDPDLWPMVPKTGVARLALATGRPVIPVAHFGAHEVLPYGSKRPRLFPRKTIHVTAGPPVDLSKYRDAPSNAETLRAATADVMKAITDLLADIRGEEPPAEPYDPARRLREARRAARERRPA